jgi:Cu(I)/Ag(I) efflux system membrane protein CusA/SilA
MMEVMTVKTSNNDVGGRKFEMSNMVYRAGLGYIKNIKDVEEIAIKIIIRFRES